MSKRHLLFTSNAAKLQYRILMLLFHIAFNRYLFGIFTRGLTRFFSAQNAVLLQMASGHAFKIYLNDGYWTRFVLFGGSYEPEIETVIASAAGSTDIFCDLGANKGYWSVYAANLFEKVISIEASSETYKALTENTKNISNVDRRWRAAYSKSDVELQFINTVNSHASARLGDDAAKSDATEKVRTIAVDDLLTPGDHALIKMDVEGAEADAIDGAKRALLDGSVIIYEDHGSDAACKPSAHLLMLDEIRLYSCEKPYQRLNSIEAIAALKTDPFKGYNFLAGRSDSLLLASILQGFAKL
ncbi:MAG: FkbM family methyltransferase [Pseudomonadota bacterium]